MLPPICNCNCIQKASPHFNKPVAFRLLSNSFVYNLQIFLDLYLSMLDGVLRGRFKGGIFMKMIYKKELNEGTMVEGEGCSKPDSGFGL